MYDICFMNEYIDSQLNTVKFGVGCRFLYNVNAEIYTQ